MRFWKHVLLACVLVIAVYPELSRGAGFADQTIFLSRSPVTEGDTVRIYAIVSNPATSTFAGTVAINEGGKAVGSVPVSLAAGATQTASVPWTPTAGKHTIVAQLKTSAGTVAQERSEDFVINEKPKPAAVAAPTQAAAVDSSESIQNGINSVSPQVGGVVAPLFSALDSVRNTLADVADKQLAATKPKINKTATSSDDAPAPSSLDWLWSIVYTLYFYILTLMRFIVGSAAVFYPVAAIIFLYFLYRMFRLFGRRS